MEITKSDVVYEAAQYGGFVTVTLNGDITKQSILFFYGTSCFGGPDTTCLISTQAALSQYSLALEPGPVGDTSVTDLSITDGSSDPFVVIQLQDSTAVTRSADAVRRYYFKANRVTDSLYRGIRPITTLLNAHTAGFFSEYNVFDQRMDDIFCIRVVLYSLYDPPY